MNFQPPIGLLGNTDGPTYPLEVSTDKYYYSVGERVEITITNVGEEEVSFVAIPPDLYIVDTALRIVVDTRHCPHADAIIKIPPGESYPHFWEQKYRICDPDGGDIPPSGDPVDEGKYLLSAGMEDSIYGGIVQDIWDSVWIEIGPVNVPPVADAGPDQTVNEGDTVQFDGTGSSSSASGTGTWENKSLEPFPAHGVASTALDGLIYYIGGDPIDCIVEPTNQTIVYDPVANTSTWLSFMPGARQLHGVTTANGKVYAIGGSDGIYSTDTVFEYDPLTDKWTTKAPMPIPMEAFGIATVNNKIYTVGGWSTFLFCYPCGEVYEYDPIADNWTMKATMPTSRAYLTAAALDGLIYAIGGDAPGDVDTVEIYDPVTNTWTTGTSMPTARQGLSAEALDGKIYAFGGNGTGMSHMNTTEVYDPISDSWSTGPNLNEMRAHFGSATVGDCIYSLGGMPWGFMGEPQPNSTEVLCISTGELTYEWDLDDSADSDGDGNFTNDADATGPTHTHVYGDDGTYTVTLKVTDSSGLADTDTCEIKVLNVAPTAVAGGPYQGFEGSPIKLVGDHSDPGFLDTHTYEWDLSYDGTTFNPEGTGNPFQKTWYDDHSGNVALRVTDDDGGWDIEVAVVTVVNVPPIADAGDDKEGYEVSTFVFDGSFYDPGTGDTHTFEWDFNYDGLSFDVEATGQSVSHTFADDFDGQIALRVTDDDGGADIDTAHVLVKNVPPTVTLEVLPLEVNAFLRIAGEKWHDVTIELYEDGVLIANGTLIRYPGSPDDQMLDLSDIQYDYSKEYVAVVTYTPEDDPVNGQPNGANPCWIILRFGDGQELWIHHTFNVQHPETYVWEVDLTAAILSHGMKFKATGFDPGADDLTFFWDFGDDTNASNYYENVNGTYPVQITELISHVFLGSGTYVVVLIVEDDDGGVGTASVTVVIP
jgi:N-acetylneuraminic acid mutarotase